MISPSSFDLLSLRIFVVAAHARSLTKTAQVVHMTLSAVSRRISELEVQVGNPVFERRASGLELTAAGQSMLPLALKVVGDVERLSIALNDFSRGIRGRVRIWANTSSVIQFLPRDLFEFRQAHPSIEIELEERLGHETVRALQAGDIDLGIVAENTDALGLRRSFYRQDKLVVVVPRNHELTRLPGTTFDEMLKYDLVGTNRGSAILQLLTQAASARGQSLNIKLQASSFDAILSLVEAGHGISVLPAAAIGKSLERRNLTMISLKGEFECRRLCVAHREEGELSADAIALLRHLTFDRESLIGSRLVV